MSFFEFPHMRSYDDDLGWLIWAMRKLIGDMQDFTDINSIKFGDPINWNISTQYEPTTIVVDDEGNGYISRKAVPAGIALTDASYWTRIFNFSDITDAIRESITVNAGNSATTPTSLSKDDLVWWNGTIYKVLYDIAAGTAFIEGTNVIPYTVNARIQEVGATIGNIEQEIATVSESVETETENRETADAALADAISAESEARANADEELENRISELSNIEDRAQLEDITSNNITFRVGSVTNKGAYYIAELPEFPKFYRNLNLTPLIEMIRSLDKSIIINGSHQGPYMINGVATLEERSADALYFCAFSENGMRFRWIADGGYSAADLETMGKEGASSFSPIIENGQKFNPPASLLNRTIGSNKTFGDYIYNAQHPRTVIAEDNDGKFYFIIFSGRSFNTQGYNYDDMYDVLVSENITKNAFNFDGGHSSTMFVGRARVTPMFGAIEALPGAFYID